MKRRCRRILLGSAALSMIAVSVGVILAGDPSKTSRVPPDLVPLIQSVTDAVLTNHIDPPARQQMILTGVKALLSKAPEGKVPEGLSRRVSQVTTAEELAALLEDIWPAAPTNSASAEELVEVLL